jgi:glycosyltransferase involved in cell wall biosynthesis
MSSSILTPEKQQSPLKVCICTSYRADREPRAPRHATAIAQLGSGVEVTLVECSPMGQNPSFLNELNSLSNLRLITHFFPERKSNLIGLLINRARKEIALFIFRLFKFFLPSAFNANIVGLQKILESIQADVYLAHNIDTLLPTANASRKLNALLMFDSMEFHSDMGDSQTPLEKEMTRLLESKYLPICSLILASSDQVADALVDEYKIDRPLPLYNVPKIHDYLPPKVNGKFSLYWRNSVVGLSQRGLEEALLALSELPENIELHLQGRLPIDGGKELRKRISELNIENRVMFHPPYQPRDAINVAAIHTLGLCLERKGIRNHDLTVSNKMFDYMMAGLPVIASNLPSLKNIIEKSNGGLLFEPGSYRDLSKQVTKLYNDPELLNTLGHNARAFALSSANWEIESQNFVQKFKIACNKKL